MPAWNLGGYLGAMRGSIDRWMPKGRDPESMRKELEGDLPEPNRAFWDFKVNGKPYSMPLDDVTRTPSDDELDQWAWEQDHKSLWTRANEGLSTTLGKKPRQMAQELYEQADKQPGGGDARRLLGGFYEGIGNTAEQALTSPLSIASLGGGELAMGLHGATSTVRGIGQLGRGVEFGAAGAQAGHGLYGTVTGNIEGGRKQGLLELGMGGLGMYGASTRGPAAAPKQPPFQLGRTPQPLRGQRDLLGPAPGGGPVMEGEIIPEGAPPGGYPPLPRRPFYPTERPPTPPRNPYTNWEPQGGPFTGGGPIQGQVLELPTAEGLQVAPGMPPSIFEGSRGGMAPGGGLPGSRFGLSRATTGGTAMAGPSPVYHGGRQGLGTSLYQAEDVAPVAQTPAQSAFYGLIPERYKPAAAVSNQGLKGPFDVVPPTDPNLAYSQPGPPQGGIPPQRGALPGATTGLENVRDAEVARMAKLGDGPAIQEMRNRARLKTSVPEPPPPPPAAQVLAGPIHPRPVPPSPPPTGIIRSPAEQLGPVQPQGLTQPQAPVAPAKAPVGPVTPEGLAPTGISPEVDSLVGKLQEILKKKPTVAGKALEDVKPIETQPGATTAIGPDAERVAVALEAAGNKDLAAKVRAAEPGFTLKQRDVPLTDEQVTGIARGVVKREGGVKIKGKSKVAAKPAGTITKGKVPAGEKPTAYEGFPDEEVLKLAQQENPLAITEAHRRRIDKLIRPSSAEDRGLVRSKVNDADILPFRKKPARGKNKQQARFDELASVRREAQSLGIDPDQYADIDGIKWAITKKIAQETQRTGINPLAKKPGEVREFRRLSDVSEEGLPSKDKLQGRETAEDHGRALEGEVEYPHETTSKNLKENDINEYNRLLQKGRKNWDKYDEAHYRMLESRMMGEPISEEGLTVRETGMEKFEPETPFNRKFLSGRPAKDVTPPRKVPRAKKNTKERILSSPTEAYRQKLRDSLGKYPKEGALKQGREGLDEVTETGLEWAEREKSRLRGDAEAREAEEALASSKSGAVEGFRENLFPATTFKDTKFVLPDGTQLGGRGEMHEHAALDAGWDLKTAMEQGIMRTGPGYAEVSTPITSKQAQYIADAVATHGDTWVEVAQSGKSRGSKKFSAGTTADRIRNWVKSVFKDIKFGSDVADDAGFDVGSGPDPFTFGKKAYRAGKEAYKAGKEAWQSEGRPRYEKAKGKVYEQAGKTRPSKYAYETASEVKYSGKSFLRSVPDLIKGIGESGISAMEKMGPRGRALIQMIQRSRIEEDRRAARFAKAGMDPEKASIKASREVWNENFRTPEVGKKGDTWYNWEKLDKMVAGTEDPELARDIVNKYFGRTAEQGKRYKPAVKAIAELETAMKLSQFIISNTANIVMTAGKANIKGMGKAAKQMLMSEKGIRASFRAAVEEARETGALQPLQAELKHELGMSKKVGKLYGIEWAEKVQRTFASIAGKHTADELFTQIKAGKGGEVAKKRMRELMMEDDISKIMNQSRLTDSQRSFAGNRMSEMTQGRAGSIDLPPIWTSHPIANLLTQFKRYAFTQARNTNQAFKTDPKRMIAAIVGAGAVVGEGVGDTKAIINGIGRSLTGPDDLGESIRKNLADRGEGGWRIAQNIGDAWALGLMLDLIKSAGRGEAGFPGFVGGPAVQDIGRIVSSIWEGGEALLDPKKTSRAGTELKRQALENLVPMFGRGLSQGMAPRNNPKPRKNPMFALD